MRALLIFTVFAASVFLMYRKKLNTLVGLPVMALLIGVFAGMPWQNLLKDVISDGALRLAAPMMTIIFGATLAELVKRTGIVEVLIKNTAEFLGDRLFPISIFLLALVSLLFSVLGGLGAIVMVGSIVLPIMISLGMSRLLSGCVFLLGTSLGGALNLMNWSLFSEVLKLPNSQILYYTIYFFPIAFAIAVFFIWVELRREGGSSFKLKIPPLAQKNSVHPAAFLTPVIPVAIVFINGLLNLRKPDGFEFPILAAMLIGIIYGVITAPASTGPKTRLLTKSIFEGISQVAPAIALMIGIGMLLKSVGSIQVKLLLTPLLAGILPHTPLGYFSFFAIAAPLALYRGPLNLWGMGSGLLVLMKDSGHLPAAAIMAALVSVGQIQGVSDPTNTANVWIANYLGVDVLKIMKKTLLYMWLTAMIGLGVAAHLYF